MTIGYHILLPELVTDLVTNPSLETATTGYTLVGGTIAQSATRSRRGAYSLAITPTAGTADGAYYGTVSLTSGSVYTFSVDFWGVDTIPYRIYFATTGGTVKGTPTTITGAGRWIRYSVTWTADATASFRLYFVKNSDASTGVFYVDGVLCWQGDHDTSYFDGDSIGFLSGGHYWTGAAHASTSVRLAAERSGGQEISLLTAGFTVRNPIGAGMPPIAHHTQGQALQPGAEYVGYKVMPRVIDLAGAFTGTDDTDLHSKRKDIIDYIKPDRVREAQPFVLRYYYSDGRGPACMRLVYDSGAEMNVPKSWIEYASIRCIAYDPFVYEDGQEGAVLTTSQTLTAADYVAAKVSGDWVALGTGMNGIVRDIAFAANGDPILVGSFTTGNGVTLNYIGRWNGTTFVTVGGTSCNAYIQRIFIGPDGTYYIGGNFTTAPDGTAAVRIAKSTDEGVTWTAFGSGCNAVVEDITIDKSGNLYIVGLFTTANGVTVNYIARWTGSTFATVGGTSCDAEIMSIFAGIDNNIYIGGQFTVAPDGTSAARAAYTADGTTWVAMSTGLSAGQGQSILQLANNLIYYGGTFATAGGITANDIAVWNGASWAALGSGSNVQVFRLGLTGKGDLIALGSFTTMGGLTVRYSALWNGSTWAYTELDVEDAIYVYAGNPKTGNEYIGGAFNASPEEYAEQNTITNTGTTAAWPVLTIKRSGGTSALVKYLENQTTGHRLYLNYALLDGETLTLDFRPGKKTIKSSFFGPVMRASLRNSDFAEFNLLSGANLLGAYIYKVGSPTVTSLLSWNITHWSIDGIAA